MKKRKPWKSLRFRLIVWYSLLAGLSMIVSDGFMYFEFRRTLLKQVDNTLEILTIQAAKNIDDEVDTLKFDPRENAPILAALLEESGVSVSLLDQNGLMTEQFGQSLVLPALTDIQTGFQTISQESGRWRIYTQEITPQNGRPAGWLRLGHSLRYMDATSSDVLNQQLLEIPLILMMVGLGGLFLANRALKPIDQITEMAAGVRVSGDLTQRINYQGAADELERLSTMFNEMLESLQKTFDREKRFTADTSHELRTPLAAMKGRLHVALSQPRTVESYQETLAAMNHEVERLIRLSSDLLALSQLEQQHHQLAVEAIDFSDLLAAIAEQMEPIAELHHLDFKTDISPQLEILGSPDHLIRLFINLLDNAMKYTPEPGKVRLSAKLQDQSIQVVVSDTGIGVSAENLSHLFERFYQVESSRSDAFHGTGLGLAIVQEIVYRYGGAIAVESQLKEGTTVTVTLPKVSV